MEPMGYKPGMFNTFSAVMIGYLVNAGVPRLGEVVKCTILSKYEKVRADKLVGTIVMERAVDSVSLLVVFALALVFQGKFIGNYVKESFSGLLTNKSGETSVYKIILVLVAIVIALAGIYFIFKIYLFVSF